MFQTDLIRYLQLWDNELITQFLSFISLLGTTPAVLIFILGITFAIDFKRGLVLINIIAWTAILTVFLKEQINYPRPIDVDSSLKTVYFESNTESYVNLLPADFFSLFSDEVLQKTRSDEFERFGFPSGHVSIQFSLWFSLFFLFRKRWIKTFGISMILLTMLSRLYLGHHFLGDVLGGVLLGGIVSFLMIYLIRRSGYLTVISHHIYSLSMLWLPIVLIPFAVYLPVWILSSLIGINLAAALIILQKNFPVFHVIAWKRILAAFISLFFIFSVIYLGKMLDFVENSFLDLLLSSLMNFAIILAAIYVNSRLYLIRFRF